MKKKIIWILPILCLSYIACDDAVYVDEYVNIKHDGQKNIEITKVVLDTIFIDGSLTSLEGEWHLKDNKLYFIDQALVGIKEFDLNGQYVAKYIEKGRGPNEILKPMLAGSFSDKGDFIGIDMGWIISLYNNSFKKEKSYVLFGDIDGDQKVWDNLLQNPDPEKYRMYEFFISSRSIRFLKDEIIIPVITEHIDYNGFYKNKNTRDFWLKSYNFLTIDIQNRKTGKLFGHYPPIFRERNIPAFSLLSFDTDDDHIYCSYGADSLIYIRDIKGKIVNSIGFAASAIKGEYPETETFEDFLSNHSQHEKKYGYYRKVKLANNHLFRSYKKDGNNGYGLQIYKNNDLIGDLDFSEEMYIIGYSGGFYYGVLPVNIDLEQFRIVKFKL